MSFDFAEIRGQHSARRAAEIAAAGGHGMLLIGPPGSAAPMIGMRMTSILPPLSPEESAELTPTLRAAGILALDDIADQRLYRAPHELAGMIWMFGGGTPFWPGEVAVAHRGVLHLVDVQAFRAPVLSRLDYVLRQGAVELRRDGKFVRYAAKPLLMLTSFPCPCGYHGDPARRCACSAARIAWHRERVAMLRDHVDIVAHTVAAPLGLPPGEDSATIRARVTAAWAMRVELTPDELVKRLDGAAKRIHTQGRDRRMLTEPEHETVLRLAYTIACLDASDVIRGPHVAEAFVLATVTNV